MILLFQISYYFFSFKLYVYMKSFSELIFVKINRDFENIGNKQSTMRFLIYFGNH